MFVRKITKVLVIETSETHKSGGTVRLLLCAFKEPFCTVYAPAKFTGVCSRFISTEHTAPSRERIIYYILTIFREGCSAQNAVKRAHSCGPARRRAITVGPMCFTTVEFFLVFYLLKRRYTYTLCIGFGRLRGYYLIFFAQNNVIVTRRFSIRDKIDKLLNPVLGPLARQSRYLTRRILVTSYNDYTKVTQYCAA